MTITSREMFPPQCQGPRNGRALMKIWQELQQRNVVVLPTVASLLGHKVHMERHALRKSNALRKFAKSNKRSQIITCQKESASPKQISLGH